MQILLADDHGIIRDTLRAYLEADGLTSVTTVTDYPSAMTLLDHGSRFDLVLLDLDMPGMNGLAGLAQAVEAYPSQTFAIISGCAPNRIAHEAVALGAAGFIPKTMSARSLSNALGFMVSGETYVPASILTDMGGSALPEFARQLSQREREVLSGLCEGRANKEIAHDLGLQEVTIKLHVRTLCRKLNARNRTQAALIARTAGYQ